jgi:spore maturation protein CgeB
MKIGYISCFNRWHTETVIADHLERAGHEVWRYQQELTERRKFNKSVKQFDFVFTALPCNFPVSFWREIKEAGVPLVTWFFDWIWNFRNREEQYLPQLREFDLVITTEGDVAEKYRNAGIRNYRYLQTACDTDIYKPGPPNPDYECEIAFIGHVYTDRRRKLLRDVGERFDLRIMGLHEECWGDLHPTICNSAKLMLSDNYRNDLPGYWSDRVYHEVGSGACLLHPRIPWMDRYFEGGKHLVYWDDEADLFKKIDYYLKHDTERERIGRAGSKHVHQRHSWEVRIKEFEDIICESGLSPIRTFPAESVSLVGNSLSTSAQTQFSR